MARARRRVSAGRARANVGSSAWNAGSRLLYDHRQTRYIVNDRFARKAGAGRSRWPADRGRRRHGAAEEGALGTDALAATELEMKGFDARFEDLPGYILGVIREFREGHDETAFWKQILMQTG